MDLEIANKIGSTPLIIAAEGGKDPMVEEMLDKNANTTVENLDGHTALMKAIIHGHTKVVKILLRTDAKEPDTERSGLTALHIACSSKDTKATMIDLLVVEGYGIDARGDTGRLPLHDASRIGNLDVAKALLEKQADVSMKDTTGRTATIVAWQNGHLEVTKLLRQHAKSIGISLDSLPAESSLPIWSLAKIGDQDRLDKALKLHYSAINVRDPDTDSTALHWAIRSRKIDITGLLDAGACVSAVDDHRRTALHIAAELGNYEATELILIHDAELESRNSWDLTPLAVALSRRNYLVAAQLVEAGAEIGDGMMSCDLQPILYESVRNGFLKAAERLFKVGADLEGRDEEGQTAIDLARAFGDAKVLDWVQRRAYQSE